MAKAVKLMGGCNVVGADLVCPLHTVGATSVIEKASGLGTLILSNSKKAPFEDFHLYGWSRQETTTGAQLFDGVWETGRLNASNGDIISTETSIVTNFIPVEPNKKYYFGLKSANYYPVLYDAEKQFSRYLGLKVNSFSFDTNENEYYLRISQYEDTKVFEEAMLNVGSTALPWEPYTGGAPSPSPEYPQEIVSAGQVKTTGAQLFDGSYTKDKVLNTDGTLTTYAGRSTTDFIKVEANTIYTGFPLFLRIAFYDSDKNFISYNDDASSSRTTAEGTAFLRFNFLNGKENEIMINKGNTSLPYEPYTGGQPGIADVGIETRVTGKNLFDAEKANDRSNWVEVLVQSGYSDFAVYVGKGNKFTVSYQGNLTTGLGFYAGVALSHDEHVRTWLYHSTSESLITNAVSGEATEDNIYIRCNSSMISNMLDALTNLQVEIDTEPTSYEPYTPQSLTLSTPTGLPGVPVTSGGNYTDESGQQWVCDEIDLERGKRIQRVAEKVMDSTVIWIGKGTWGNVDDYKTLGFYAYIDGTNSSFDWGSKSDAALCNHFKLNPYGSYDNSIIAFSICPSYIAFRVPSSLLPTWDRDNPSNAPFVQWLEEQKDSGNPVIVKYILATPIETPIPAADLAAYRALRTNYPTTVIANDEDVWMEVGYKAKA